MKLSEKVLKLILKLYVIILKNKKLKNKRLMNFLKIIKKINLIIKNNKRLMNILIQSYFYYKF